MPGPQASLVPSKTKEGLPARARALVAAVDAGATYQRVSLAGRFVTRHLSRCSGTPLRVATVRESDGCGQPAWRSGRDSQQTKQPLRAEAVDGADSQKCVVGSIAFTCFACSRSIPSQSIGFCCAQTARPFDQSIETTPATDPTRMQAPADRPKRQCCAGPPMRSQLHAHTPLGQERRLHQAAVVARLDDRARCQVEGGLPAGQQVGRVGGGCCASKPCQCGQPGRRQSSSTSGWPCSHPHLVPRPKTDPLGLSPSGGPPPPPPVNRHRCVALTMPTADPTAPTPGGCRGSFAEDPPSLRLHIEP